MQYEICINSVSDIFCSVVGPGIFCSAVKARHGPLTTPLCVCQSQQARKRAHSTQLPTPHFPNHFPVHHLIRRERGHCCGSESALASSVCDACLPPGSLLHPSFVPGLTSPSNPCQRCQVAPPILPRRPTQRLHLPLQPRHLEEWPSKRSPLISRRRHPRPLTFFTTSGPTTRARTTMISSPSMRGALIRAIQTGDRLLLRAPMTCSGRETFCVSLTER